MQKKSFISDMNFFLLSNYFVVFLELPYFHCTLVSVFAPPNHFPDLRLPPSASLAGDSPSSCKQAGLRHHLGHTVLVRELLGGETEEACWWDETNYFDFPNTV